MSINNRTVFYDISTGVARFWDWALVGTDLGTMVEPYTPAKFSNDVPTINYDPTDMIAKVTEIRAADIHKEQLILSGGSQHLNGGVLVPRVGK